MVVQAGSPHSTPDRVLAHHLHDPVRRACRHSTTCTCPALRDRGFARARLTDIAPTPAVPSTAPALRFLTNRCSRPRPFSGDILPRTLDPSTLDNNPHIVEDMRHGWD